MEAKRKKPFDHVTEIPIDDSIPDVSNHPFFIEKKRWAIEFIKKHPIPKELLGNYKKPQD